jgi:hypothetical protein
MPVDGAHRRAPRTRPRRGRWTRNRSCSSKEDSRFPSRWPFVPATGIGRSAHALSGKYRAFRNAVVTDGSSACHPVAFGGTRRTMRAPRPTCSELSNSRYQHSGQNTNASGAVRCRAAASQYGVERSQVDVPGGAVGDERNNREHRGAPGSAQGYDRRDVRTRHVLRVTGISVRVAIRNSSGARRLRRGSRLSRSSSNFATAVTAIRFYELLRDNPFPPPTPGGGCGVR